MSYQLVDAVNQQFPLPKGSIQLLILTKFAELVVDPKNPRRRLGLDRFMAITRLSKDALRDNLRELDKKGYLVPLEKREKKRTGDRPTLYALQLPEGYDEKVVDARRGRYYGGKPFSPQFHEDNTNLQGTLSPVVAGSEPELSGLNPLISGSNPLISGSNPLISGSNPPYNIRRKEDIIINKGGDDDFVGEVLKRAAKLCGVSVSSFKNLGITADNASIANEAIDCFAAMVQSGEKEIDSGVGYLRTMIQNAIAAGGVKKGIGPVQAPEEPKFDFDKVVGDGWERILKLIEEHITDKRFLSSLHNLFIEQMLKHLPDDIPEYIRVIIGNVQYSIEKEGCAGEMVVPLVRDEILAH